MQLKWCQYNGDYLAEDICGESDIYLIKLQYFFLSCNCPSVNIGSGYGLMLTRQWAITWANVEEIQWHHIMYN